MDEIREKSENKLTDLQKKLLELFDWFHRFCEENQIRYYALGGTMLGVPGILSCICKMCGRRHVRIDGRTYRTVPFPCRYFRTFNPFPDQKRPG